MILEQLALIDKVIAIADTGQSIVCEAELPDRSPVFDGHFPGFATLPGIFMIEIMAQAAGYLLLARNNGTAMPILAGVEGARFRAFARPGDGLKAHAVLTHDGSGYAVLDARLLGRDGLLASAQLRLRFVSFPTQVMEEHVQAVIATYGLRELLTAPGEVAA